MNLVIFSTMRTFRASLKNEFLCQLSSTPQINKNFFHLFECTRELCLSSFIIHINFYYFQRKNLNQTFSNVTFTISSPNCPSKNASSHQNIVLLRPLTAPRTAVLFLSLVLNTRNLPLTYISPRSAHTPDSSSFYALPVHN